MNETSSTTRRAFLAKAAGVMALPAIVPSTVLGLGGSAAPSDRIQLGIIGCGGMGRGNTRGFLHQPDAHVVAVCDVDSKHSVEGAREAAKGQDGKVPEEYKDYRELLARDDVDAVCIATPDHWHALCTVAAAKAKKDIYCQKPMAHTFAEGQAMVRAVAENDVILQVGSQQRSQNNFRRAVELVRNGVIGKVKHVEVGLPTGHKAASGDTKVQDPPANVDYDFWCGPSPKLPYVPARLHWNWRWHLSYGGGQLMDWIGHHNDIAHWGLDMDKSGPIEVRAFDFVYPEDRSVWNSAWKYEVWCKYEGGLTTSISNQYERGCKWIGEDGWIFVARGKFRASNPAWTRGDFNPGDLRVYNSPEHHRNFLDGVKSRKPCICPAETGHRSITPGHLGLLSEALGGRTIRWDPKKETVIGDAEAEKLLKKIDYRGDWTL